MACDFGVPVTENEEFYFISYNSEDADRVASIVRKMHEDGVPIWYDKGIDYGDLWEEVITTHVADAKAVIIFFTQGILEKDESYVSIEYEMAKKYFKKPIYIIFLDEIDEQNVPRKYVRWMIELNRLQNIHRIHFTDSQTFTNEILKLVGCKPSQYNVSDLNEKSKKEVRDSGLGRYPTTIERGTIIQLGHAISGLSIKVGTPISWKVLKCEGDTAILLCEDILVSMPFHDVQKSASDWENCTLRKWLNGEFYDTAFSDEEKEYIVQAEILARKNPKYKTPAGFNTRDMVFLMDIMELQTYMVKEIADISSKNRNISWWLRNPGFSQNFAANVGWRVHYGGFHIDEKAGVRPAIRIRIQ